MASVPVLQIVVKIQSDCENPIPVWWLDQTSLTHPALSQCHHFVWCTLVPCSIATHRQHTGRRMLTEIIPQCMLDPTLPVNQTRKRLTVPSCSHPSPQKEFQSGSELHVGPDCILWQQWVPPAEPRPPLIWGFDFQTLLPPQSVGSLPGVFARAARHRQKNQNLRRDRNIYHQHCLPATQINFLFRCFCWRTYWLCRQLTYRSSTP